jgi:hypothetical protein
LGVVEVLRRMAKQAGRHRYPASLLLEPPAGGFAALDRETREDGAAIDAAQLSCYAVLALMLAIVWWAPEIVEVTSWIRD